MPSMTRVTSTGRPGVAWVSRVHAMNRPSGETRGLEKSNSGTLSSTRRLPLATSIITSSLCDSPAGFHCHHPVTSDVPSGVSSNACPSSARPGSGVRSRSPANSAASPGSAATAGSSSRPAHPMSARRT